MESNTNKIPWIGNEQKHKSKKIFVQFFVNKLNRDILKTIKKLKPDIKTILDIGCGEGFITRQIAEKHPNFAITALDAESSYIDYANANNLKSNIHYSVQNLESIDIAKKYDLVIMTEVLEHTPQPDLVLKKIMELTNKYAIITVPNEPFFRLGNLLAFKYIKTFGNTPGHIHNWSKNGLHKMLKKMNLKHTIKTSCFWNIAIIEK